jgi:CubicO group peptidase (beta-lactamase class C family)
LRGDIGGIAWATFFAEKASPTAERRRMLKLILKEKPEFSRGEYHYSNLGYAVAAAMLEKSTGEAFETMMLRDVFKPLKMDSADFRTMKSAKQLKAPMLWGHQANGKPISPKIAGAENPSVYASAGTVHITIADYAKYAQWHLKNEPAPLLSTKEALDHVHAGVIDVPSLGGKYGGGWIHLKAGFGRAMTHTGSNTNSFAVLWILPDKDFAAIACCNTGEQSGFLACDAAIVELMKRYAK